MNRRLFESGVGLAHLANDSYNQLNGQVEHNKRIEEEGYRESYGYIDPETGKHIPGITHPILAYQWYMAENTRIRRRADKANAGFIGGAEVKAEEARFKFLCESAHQLIMQALE